MAPKPAGVSFAEAAALADATALCFLRDKAGLRAGQAVLINGASGAVGSAAVQLAVHFGAVVTGVCSGPHAGLVRKLGAESVIDYTRTDFTRAGRRYDVIFDVAGKSSFGRCRRALNPGGVYLTTAPSPAIIAADAVDGEVRVPRAVVAFTGLRRGFEKRRTCWLSGSSWRRRRWSRWSGRATRWSGSPRRTAASTRGTRRAILS